MDSLDRRVPGPALMGVVNVTPDSFSDGGRFDDPRDVDELVLTPGNRADVLVTMAEGRSVLRTLPFDRGSMGMGAPLSNTTGADLATLTVAGAPSPAPALVLAPSADRAQ